MGSFNDALNRLWRTRNVISCALWPLSLLYRTVIRARRLAYSAGWLESHRFDVPVIVVGNLSVGGTGKTPVVIAIANLLKNEGWSPGIISRGYGGSAENWPQTVTPESSADLVGDEPVVIARRAGCPVVVAPDRPAAARRLLENNTCNVLISDDGLQHLALNRDIEIAVVDGGAGFGNGFCLPAGPLREPVSRLDSVDFVVYNGGRGDGHRCVIEGDCAVKLINNFVSQLLGVFSGRMVHAVAAIGNPARFFEHLRSAGLEIIEHPFPDHHKFDVADLRFDDDDPILMTEKDAVKCETFAGENMWYVPVDARLAPSFQDELSKRLNSL